MRAALICTGLLLVAAQAAAEPPQCRHLNRQIEHFNEMRDRAAVYENDLWEDRIGQHLTVLKKQRKAAGCKETAGEAAERQLAVLTALLKAAGKGALTFFTMGAM